MSTSDYYNGCTLFQSLADSTGLSLDKINFCVSQLFALVVAAVFRKFFHRKNASIFIRHMFCFSIGVFLAVFCFGWHSIHLFVLPFICFLILLIQPLPDAQKSIFVVSMMYLLCIHLERQLYNYASYTLDITGPLMVIVQKLTSFTFFLRDDDTTTSQSDDRKDADKLRTIGTRPNLVEFFGYIFQFQTLLAGPLVFYNDYIRFIEGCRDADTCSPRASVAKKVTTSLICAYVFLKLTPVFSEEYLRDEHFLYNTSALYKMLYIMMVSILVRCKYYHAWIFADAICNNSGLGFNGFDSRTGQAKWDLVTNVNILNFEFGLSMRDSIDAWNVGTNKWLRLAAYDRLKSHRLLLTYVLSAVWHGCYPGYYFTFLNGALFTFVSRKVRRAIRSQFQQSSLSKYVYDGITCLTTRFALAYMVFPFFLLEFEPVWNVYKSLFFCMHILSAIALLIVSFVPQPNTHDNSKYPSMTSAQKVK